MNPLIYNSTPPVLTNNGQVQPQCDANGRMLTAITGTVSVAGTVPISGTVSTSPPKSATGTPTNVASSASSVTVLAANANRLGAAVFNDSTQVLYLLLGTTAASTSNYTVQIGPNVYYEVPFNYTGQLTGIWASANGNARVTELT